MFSERFNQLAKLAGIDTEKLIQTMESVEEKFKDLDKDDINVAVSWLDTISSEITTKEMSFLLMASLTPETSLEDYDNDGMEQFFEMLREQGFTQLPDGTWIKPVFADDVVKKEPTVVNEVKLPDGEQRVIGYTPSVEAKRNALGYDHSQPTVLEAIGIDEDLLNQRLESFTSGLANDAEISKSIEALEREFTRKELAYMFSFKSRQLNKVITETNEEIESLQNQITITNQKPKRTTKNKKEQ